MKATKSYKFVVLALSLLLTGSILMAQVVESEQKKQNEIQADEMKAAMEMQKAMQAEGMQMRKEMLEEQRNI